MWRSHPVKLWFRLTFLLASLTGMATTIVAEEGARCGVVGMIDWHEDGPGAMSVIPSLLLLDAICFTATQYRSR